jgi:hypothetical protein
VFLLSNTTLRLVLMCMTGLLAAPFMTHPSFAQMDESAPVSPLKEYYALLDRVLPCPSPALNETRDYQLCILVRPPGLRLDERELLVVVQSRGDTNTITIRQPETGLFALGIGEHGASSPAVTTFQTADPTIGARILGRHWRDITTTLIPHGEWYTDPTIYRIVVSRMTGSTILEVSGPGPRAMRQPTRLLAWLESVRSRAEHTLANAPRGISPISASHCHGASSKVKI